jgi:hypothetical protein
MLYCKSKQHFLKYFSRFNSQSLRPDKKNKPRKNKRSFFVLDQKKFRIPNAVDV